VSFDDTESKAAADFPGVSISRIPTSMYNPVELAIRASAVAAVIVAILVIAVFQLG